MVDSYNALLLEQIKSEKTKKKAFLSLDKKEHDQDKFSEEIY